MSDVTDEDERVARPATLPGRTLLVEPSPWDRRRDGRALVLLFLFVWVLFLATASYTVDQVNDSRETALAAWSLGTRGTLALPEDWQQWPDALRWDVEGVDGHTYTNRFPGSILWGAPFYAVGEVVSPTHPVPHPWLGPFAPAGVAAATVTALAVGVCFAVYRRLAERRLALAAALTVGLGTGLWSVAADALWTHGPAALTLALGMLALSSRRYAGTGAAFGVAILVRPQLAVVPAVTGLWHGWRERSLRPVVTVGVISALGLAAMSLYSQALFGTWLPVAGYSEGRVTAVVTTGGAEFSERLLHAFINPARGVFIYTPLLLILLPGVVRGYRAAPAWVRSAALAGVVYFIVQFRANTWHGGRDFFGNRLALETLVLISPLMLVTFRRVLSGTRFGRRLVTAVAVGSIGLHALGATVWQTGLLGYDGPPTWHRNISELCEEEPEVCADYDGPWGS